MITNSKELDKTSIRISALRRDKEKILSSSPSLMGLQEASRRRLRQVMTAISLIKGMGGRERTSEGSAMAMKGHRGPLMKGHAAAPLAHGSQALGAISQTQGEGPKRRAERKPGPKGTGCNPANQT